MKYLALLIAVIIGLAITFMVVRKQGDEYADFMKDSYKASGFIVTQKEVVIDPKNQRKEMQIDYRYMAGGSTHIRQEKVEYADIWSTLTPGSQSPIYVNKNNPEEAYLALPMDRRLKLAGKHKDK